VRKAIPLKVAGAYHSQLMKSAEQAMVAHLQTAQMVPPPIPVAANFTGALTITTDSVRELLARQVSGSVRWETCIQTLIGLGIEQFVEFGPGGVLAGLLKRIDPTKPCLSIGNLAQLEEHHAALSA
jgi:[acyl-carrier-protein] S-malonyltransferase